MSGQRFRARFNERAWRPNPPQRTFAQGQRETDIVTTMRTTGTELAQQFGQCYHAADRGKPSGDGHPMSYSELPLTRYAMSGDVSVAYQTMGDGPIDIIAIPGAISHVEFLHEMPGYTAFLQRLSKFARVITFDKRGQGLSDRISGAPTLESAWMTFELF